MEKIKVEGLLRENISNDEREEIILIGYPFDEGAKRAGIRCGQDNAPDCMRRFLGTIGFL